MEIDLTAETGRAGGTEVGPAALWDHVRETVVALDGAGVVRAASPSWRAYGHDVDSLTGLPIITLVHPDERPAVEAYLFQPDLVEDEPFVRARLRCGDGSWLECVARMRRGERDRLFVSFLPLDEATRRTFELERRAAEQLRVVDEMRRHLVEVVAHGLRDPLTVVSGFAQTLQRDQAAEMRFDHLREIGASIERHAARLRGSVTDLFDLGLRSSRDDVDGAQLVDLAPVVSQRVTDASLGSREVHVEVAPVAARVDVGRFARIVEALLDNVARHTGPDTTVTVRLEADDGDARLEVVDDGPGLPDELQDEVFSPFVQGRLRDPSGQGLGLGLALVRRFTELHGGRCWHETVDPHGARFVVVLPGPSSGGPLDELAEELRDLREVHDRERRHDGDHDDPVVELGGTVDAMLRMAREALGMQVAYVNTFTDAEQILVAANGDGATLGVRAGTRVPLDQAYCPRMLAGELPNVVADTAERRELASLTPTTNGIVSYVGVPIHDPDGVVLGTLCCADDQPHPEIRASEVAVLQAIAGLVADQMERQELSGRQHREVRGRVQEVLARRDGLQMLYQPIVRLADGTVDGVEALARFPDQKVRPPDLWFADAARVGLAGELEQLAVVRALSGLRQLPEPCYLSLNLSPAAIAAGALRALLGKVALDRIVIEITEHAAVEDYERLLSQLRPFRAGGARLAIDDVGSGFASLRHVLRMQPDIIKLDRSLVGDVTTDVAQHAIAVAFARLADELDVKLVAEGVEDLATLAALREAGVTHGQGWYFARPTTLPLTTFAHDVGPAPA